MSNIFVSEDAAEPDSVKKPALTGMTLRKSSRRLNHNPSASDLLEGKKMAPAAQAKKEVKQEAKEEKKGELL